jgi:hypothetical protein
LGLISEIMGSLRAPRRGNAGTGDRIAAVEAALGRLNHEREAASAKLNRNADRRTELLTIDDSDAEIAAVEADTDRRHRDLERLEAVEASLLAELAELRTGARAAEWRRLEAALLMAADAYLVAGRHACTALARYTGTVDEARAAGFEANAHPYIGPPTLIDGALFDAWESRRENLRSGKAPIPRLATPATAMLPPVRPPAPFPPTPQPAAPKPKPKRALRRDRSAAPDQRLVSILRDGMEIDGFQATVGDVIAVPAAAAQELLRAGSVDLVGGAL